MEIIELPINQLEPQYQENQPLYTKLCSELLTQLNELISEAGVSLAFPIEYRVKTWKSIYEKCQRKSIYPEKIGEIPDIAGIRIILLFKHDLDKSCEIIEQTFEILQKEDTNKRLGSDKFGYGSIHYELTPPEQWLSVPSLRRLKGLRAEVQSVRHPNISGQLYNTYYNISKKVMYPFPFVGLLIGLRQF